MVQQILRITQNTLFKLRPEQSGSLKPNEVFAVMAGMTFPIQSYAYADINGDFNGHIKFALEGQSIRGFNTWFVYGRHIQVEFDGVVVYPHEEQDATLQLRIIEDTILKRRPVQSSTLPPDQQAPVADGRIFPLQSYAYADDQGDFSSHIKFTMRNPADYIRGFNTWFVFDQHANVEFDGEVVFPIADPNVFTLRITRDTVIKRRPVQSSQLAPEEKFAVPKGTVWKLQSYAFADANGDFNGHIKFALKYEKDYVYRLSTWYVYSGDAQVEQRGRVVYPPTPPLPPPTSPPQFQGTPFRLPGNSSTFYTDQPIFPGSSFTWGEATKDATRIPETVEIVDNIVALARQLQRARNQIGRPFIINSWYRPPAVNNAVGGARRSQHLFGKAADIQVPGYSGRRVANAIMLWWPGGIGIYSNLPDLIHLDIGPKRTWGF
jgi:hypothetical protein